MKRKYFLRSKNVVTKTNKGKSDKCDVFKFRNFCLGQPLRLLVKGLEKKSTDATDCSRLTDYSLASTKADIMPCTSTHTHKRVLWTTFSSPLLGMKIPIQLSWPYKVFFWKRYQNKKKVQHVFRQARLHQVSNWYRRRAHSLDKVAGTWT